MIASFLLLSSSVVLVGDDHVLDSQSVCEKMQLSSRPQRKGGSSFFFALSLRSRPSDDHQERKRREKCNFRQHELAIMMQTAVGRRDERRKEHEHEIRS